MAISLNITRNGSIDKFKNKLLDGGARPSLFQMDMTWPTAMPFERSATELMPFHCKISEIPSSQVTPITVKYQGREVKYAGQRTFTNLTVTILNDEGFTVRQSLERWIEQLNGAASNKTTFNKASPVPDGYAGMGIVTQYDKQGDSVRAYRFVDLFPVTLSNIQLSWDNDAQLEEYTCEFAYQYWDTPQVTLKARPFAQIVPFAGT